MFRVFLCTYLEIRDALGKVARHRARLRVAVAIPPQYASMMTLMTRKVASLGGIGLTPLTHIHSSHILLHVSRGGAGAWGRCQVCHLGTHDTITMTITKYQEDAKCKTRHGSRTFTWKIVYVLVLSELCAPRPACNRGAGKFQVSRSCGRNRSLPGPYK